MHPADQFDAFKALVDGGKSVKDVALGFGVPEQLVEKRLALARVAPELMAAYRADKLTLECLMGFTITDDHKRQVKVFKGLNDWQRRDGNTVRRLLSDEMPKANSEEVLFVGLEAYKKAGGKVRVDLFDDENEGYIESPDILQQLVQEKLEAAAERMKKKGWAWAELPPESYEERYRYGSINRKKDGSFDPKEMQSAGCFISVSHDGKLHVTEGCVKPQDKKATGNQAKPGKAEAKPEPGMSNALLLSLKAFRVQVAEVAIASKPELAYDLLVFSAAQRLIADESAGGLDIKFFNKTPNFSETKGTPAANTLADIKGNLPLDWLDADTEAGQFAAFQKLKPEQKAEILAYCAALTLEPALAPDTAEQITGYDAVLNQTGTRVMDYWRPTVANYLGRITTAQLLAIGEEIFGKQWSDSRKSAKKGELAKTLEDAFAKPEKAAGGSTDILLKLLQWVPQGMEFTLPETKDKPAKKTKKAA